MPGTVESIFITAKAGDPMQPVKSVPVVAGKGLQGDRKFRDGKAGKKDEPDRDVTQRREGNEIASRAATEVEDREGRRSFDVRQKRGNVLAHVVTARALAEIVGARFVVRERALRDSLQVVRFPIHGLRRRAARWFFRGHRIAREFRAAARG